MRTPAFVATAAGILASIAAFAQGPVYSVNIVGFQKVTSSNQFSQVSNPFVKSDMSIGSVIGDQLTGGGDIDSGDNVLIWTGIQYRRLVLVEGTGDSNFDGKWFDENFDVPVTDPLNQGQGFWIKNNNTQDQITLVGDVVMDASKSVQVNAGYNMVAYPYSTSAALNSSQMNLNLATGCDGGTNIDESDVIFAWDGLQYKRYWLVDFPDEAGIHDKWLDENDSLATAVFEPGQGFWYFKRASGTFTWTTSKPY